MSAQSQSCVNQLLDGPTTTRSTVPWCNHTQMCPGGTMVTDFSSLAPLNVVSCWEMHRIWHNTARELQEIDMGGEGVGCHVKARGGGWLVVTHNPPSFEWEGGAGGGGGGGHTPWSLLQLDIIKSLFWRSMSYLLSMNQGWNSRDSEPLTCIPL